MEFKNKGTKRFKGFCLIIAVLICTVLCSCGGKNVGETTENLPYTEENSAFVSEVNSENSQSPNGENSSALGLGDAGEFSGTAYVTLNNNIPQFSSDEITTQSFEEYSQLDSLGRCGEAFACLGKDLMPTEERGSIGQVKPSGWQTVKYDFVDGKYLYNRCHLIGFQLSGENANTRNLITGTRYMNVQGMLPFENMVADYIKETNNHVMYRVTPVFKGEELVAHGVQIEAYSVEDEGDGICFNVYCYNAQPGVIIDYGTGNSIENPDETEASTVKTEPDSYVLNIKSKKIHKTDCKYAKDIKAENKKAYSGDLSDLLENGYSECKECF